MKWIRVTSTENIPLREGRSVRIGEDEIAIFNLGEGEFVAVDNACPHRGGPLGEGELEGCLLTCPWHAWQFDVRTGESATDDSKVAVYESKVEGDRVFVAL